MIRHTTDYIYPDGDVIWVFEYKSQDGKIVLSDLGETYRWVNDRFVEKLPFDDFSKFIKSSSNGSGIKMNGTKIEIVSDDGKNIKDLVNRLARFCQMVCLNFYR